MAITKTVAHIEVKKFLAHWVVLLPQSMDVFLGREQ